MAKKLPTTKVIEIMENRGCNISPKYKKYIKDYINNTPALKAKLDEQKFDVEKSDD